MKFEYFVKTAAMVGPTAEFVQKLLNDLGKEGWELVSVNALGPNLWPTFILKRPLPNATDEEPT